VPVNQPIPSTIWITIVSDGGLKIPLEKRGIQGKVYSKEWELH